MRITLVKKSHLIDYLVRPISAWNHNGEETITFVVLQSRLILHINWRINNGEFSERALARLLGISQPQMHNVRKGVRKLSVSLGDRILTKFGLSILDLLEEAEVMELLDLHNAGRRQGGLRKPPNVADGARPSSWKTKAG